MPSWQQTTATLELRLTYAGVGHLNYAAGNSLVLAELSLGQVVLPVNHFVIGVLQPDSVICDPQPSPGVECHPTGNTVVVQRTTCVLPRLWSTARVRVLCA
jgi:hypothetical protein